MAQAAKFETIKTEFTDSEEYNTVVLHDADGVDIEYMVNIEYMVTDFLTFEGDIFDTHITEVNNDAEIDNHSYVGQAIIKFLNK